MGKKQHQSDKLYLTTQEWKYFFCLYFLFCWRECEHDYLLGAAANITKRFWSDK